MPVVILCLLAVLMVDYDGSIRAIRLFADNPAVLRAVGEEFNILLRFPYDGKMFYCIGRVQGGSVRMIQLLWNCLETLNPWTPEQGQPLMPRLPLTASYPLHHPPIPL